MSALLQFPAGDHTPRTAVAAWQFLVHASAHIKDEFAAGVLFAAQLRLEKEICYFNDKGICL